MTMLAGTVDVASDGSVAATSTSLAAALYNKFWGRVQAKVLAQGQSIPGAGPELAAIRIPIAELAEDIADAIVTHITDNAEAVITDATGALQTSTAAGNPTDPPATEQTLTIR